MNHVPFLAILMIVDRHLFGISCANSARPRRRIGRGVWRHGRPKRVRHQGRRFVHTNHDRRGGVLDCAVHCELKFTVNAAISSMPIWVATPTRRCRANRNRYWHRQVELVRPTPAAKDSSKDSGASTTPAQAMQNRVNPQPRHHPLIGSKGAEKSDASK